MKFGAVSACDYPSLYLQVTIQASQFYSPTPACNVEMTRCDSETLDPTASLEVDSHAALITVFDTMEERGKT